MSSSVISNSSPVTQALMMSAVVIEVAVAVVVGLAVALHEGTRCASALAFGACDMWCQAANSAVLGLSMLKCPKSLGWYFNIYYAGATCYLLL